MATAVDSWRKAASEANSSPSQPPRWGAHAEVLDGVSRARRGQRRVKRHAAAVDEVGHGRGGHVSAVAVEDLIPRVTRTARLPEQRRSWPPL